ncbi:MAG TPA: winged helix-turn-helix domain-containing protein [Vicinamibacteria bacterium]|jgi:DNA-binding winged helix-turn-helix (wHTH) protein/Flp pilus assembly protein TadD
MAASYRFGPFTVDASSYRLTREGAVLLLSPKLIDLLLYLAARPSALVTKEELLTALWPNVNVTDNALTQAVSELRQALGDDPSKPTYIQTVARRGYRFIASVESVPERDAAVAPPSADRAAARPAIAVLDFANVSADREFAWLSSGIAETVTNDLRVAGHLRIIDRLRVIEAVRHVGTDLSALRSELHIDLAVVGAFQRAGDRLRITARAIDARSGEALADAKADGPLEGVFDLQDRIAAQFAETLGAASPDAAAKPIHRETNSLEAYQAYTEGRIRLESLDASLVPEAIADFERAVALDSRYALAHVGLATARFWQYEMSRARNQPDAALLARAIDPVRRAIELEGDLAEAHATLSFLLVGAGRFKEAERAARRAVTLDPGYWGHHYRLGHAQWGEDRLRALSRAMELYPDFPFALFEAAMVHIARGALDRAESVVREGTIVQDRQANLRQRFPAKGLHWMLGMVRLAQGHPADARAEFQREIAVGPTQLYAPEFAMNAYDGAGFVSLQAGDNLDAVAMFERALELYPEHARSLVGLGAALAAQGDQRAAEAAFKRASSASDALRRGGRRSEATLAEAFQHTVQGRPADAMDALRRLVERPELPFAGWTIPVEPLFTPHHKLPAFQAITARLAENAR